MAKTVTVELSPDSLEDWDKSVSAAPLKTIDGPADFDGVLSSLVDSYNPVNAVDYHHVTKLARAMFRQQRLWAAEEALIAREQARLKIRRLDERLVPEGVSRLNPTLSEYYRADIERLGALEYAAERLTKSLVGVKDVSKKPSKAHADDLNKIYLDCPAGRHPIDDVFGEDDRDLEADSYLSAVDQIIWKTRWSDSAYEPRIGNLKLFHEIRNKTAPWHYDDEDLEVTGSKRENLGTEWLLEKLGALQAEANDAISDLQSQLDARGISEDIMREADLKKAALISRDSLYQIEAIQKLIDRDIADSVKYLERRK